MSTRCQIDFRHTFRDRKDKPHTETSLVYRHSDGYPESVISDLKEFVKWNEGRNDDLEYTVANFIYWSKEDLRKHTEKMIGNNIDTINSLVKLGFGVCSDRVLHGDIAYFYIVDLNEKKIRVYDVSTNPNLKRWTIKNLEQMIPTKLEVWS